MPSFNDPEFQTIVVLGYCVSIPEKYKQDYVDYFTTIDKAFYNKLDGANKDSINTYLLVNDCIDEPIITIGYDVTFKTLDEIQALNETLKEKMDILKKTKLHKLTFKSCNIVGGIQWSLPWPCSNETYNKYINDVI